MRRVYLSFLGLGQYDKENSRYDYKPAIYLLNGKTTGQTQFVQTAEIEILKASAFDVVLIAATKKSHDVHFPALQSQLTRLGASPAPIILEEDMSPEGQWKWFEAILMRIEYNDRLTIDLTHGYRSIPIVFSAAINFLQKARGISLEAVYYGAFDQQNERGVPIVDMKAFYLINEWADGVSRLVEDADTRKLAEVAEQTADFQLGELNDPELIAALDSLTNSLRNVDVNSVAARATAAIRLVTEKKKSASETGKILLDLVMDKFTALTVSEPVSGRYDRAYFQIQLEIIRLLMAHKLYMQAYTVMREFISSISLIEVGKARIDNKKGRTRRYCYGEVFVNMVQYPEAEWKFGTAAASGSNREMDQKDTEWDAIVPYYRKLEGMGAIEVLRSFAAELAKYRNGFDHAWTARSEALGDIESKGSEFSEKLDTVMKILVEGGVL